MRVKSKLSCLGYLWLLVLSILFCGSAFAASVSVWISENQSAQAGSTMRVPVVVGEVAAYQRVGAFEFELNFDPAIVSFNQIITSDTLIGQWDAVVANQPALGRIRVSAADSQSIDIVTDSDSTLVYIEFTINQNATENACSALSFTQDSVIFNDGEPAAVSRNGSLCVAAAPPTYADLSLIHQISPSIAQHGQNVTISLQVDNAGPDAASDIQVAYSLPQGLTLVSGDSSYSNGLWSIASVAAASSASLNLTARFDNESDITSSAEIVATTANDSDSTPNNQNTEEDDFASASLRLPLVDIAILSQSSSIRPYTDQHTEVIYRVVNDGPDDAHGLVISMSYASDLSELQSSANLGSYASSQWNIPTLPVGSEAELTLLVVSDTVGDAAVVAELIAVDERDADSVANNQATAEDDYSAVTLSVRSRVSAPIVIRNDDGAGEGLNDASEAEPVGGNEGTTLGEQRQNALDYAASIWASMLVSDVPIVVSTSFSTDLGCDSGDPVYGYAVPREFESNFVGIPDSSVVYPVALANSITGSDLNGASAEVNFVINANIGGNCLPDASWYLGLDANPAEGQIDLVTFTLSELARGLGLYTSLQSSDGNFINFRADVFSKHVYSNSQSSLLSDMTAAERLAVLATLESESEELSWQGDTVTAYAATQLNEGVNSSGQALLSAAPMSFNRHYFFWSEQVNPVPVWLNSKNHVRHFPQLTFQALKDIGWPDLPQADLELALSVDNVGAFPGDQVTFTLTLSNTGPDAATDAVINARLPSALTYVGHQGGLSYNASNGEWQVGTIEPNQTLTMTLWATLGQSGSKQLDVEVASMNEGDVDSMPGNRVETEDDWASVTLGAADLGLQLSIDDATPNLGQSVTFTLTLTNRGPDATRDVLVDFLLSQQEPQEWVYLSHSGTGIYDPRQGVWSISSLDANASVQLQVVALLNTMEPSSPSTTITYSPLYDPNTDPLDQGGQVDVSPQQADLSLTRSIQYQSPNIGQRFNWSTVLHNDGPDIATNIVINVGFSSELTYLARSTGDYNPVTQQWTVASLGSGETTSFTLAFQAESAGSLWIESYVTSVDQADPDSTPGGREQEDDFSRINFHTAEADLSLELTSSDQPGTGESFTINVRLKNAGPDDATNGAVDINIPAGVSYVSHSGGEFDSNTGRWSVASLAANSDTTLILNLRKDSSQTITVSGEVVLADQFDSDSTPDNQNKGEDDYSQISFGLVDAALSLSASSTAPFIGDRLDLTLTMTNEGANDATSVVTSIDLPDGVEFIRHSGAGEYLEGQWTLTSLASQATESLVVTVQVNTRGSKDVAATIDSLEQIDEDSTNNQTSLTITPTASGGAKIVIVNGDGAGEGFNDPTPVSPVGGNEATTLGQQRLNAFQRAADIWGGVLNSEVTIYVESRFNPLTCSASSGVLGSAGPKNVVRDFPNAPITGTFYHQALANALAGADLNGASAEIVATFNSSIDNNSSCLSGTNWYYGLDGNPGSNIDLVSVLLHEMAHGLGFSSFVNGSNGAKFMGMDDVYSQRLLDSASGRFWPDLSDGERAASARSSGALRLSGDTLNAESVVLTNGGHGSQGVEAYAPASYQQGSSVSHFSTSLSPNELMEPSYTGVTHGVGLAAPLFADMGWPVGEPAADLSLEFSASTNQPEVAQPFTLSLALTNDGPGLATGSEIVVRLPDNLTLQQHDGDTQFDTATGLWRVPSLDSGAETTLILTLVAQSNAESSVSAELIATNRPDPDSTPDNANEGEDDQTSYTLNPVLLGDADLSLALSATDLTPRAGETMEVTLALDNAGPDSANDAVVGWALPRGLVLESSTGDGIVSNNRWTVSVAANAQASTTLVLTVNRATEFDLSAEVVESIQRDADSTPGNAVVDEDDYASLSFEPLPPFTADLSVSLTSSQSIVDLGDQLQLELVVRNDGPDNATNVELSLSLSTLSYVSHQGDGFSPASNDWTIASLGAGESAQLQVTVDVSSPISANPVLEIVSSSQMDPDSTPDNRNGEEDDMATLELRPRQANLALDVSVDRPIVAVDDPATVFVDLDNRGPDTAYNVQVRLLWPNGLTLQSVPAGYDAASGTWNIASIGPDESVSIELPGTVNRDGSFMVIGEITASDQHDSNSTPGNGVTSEDDYDTVTVLTPSETQARIIIDNMDAQGEGFNDPTPVAPVGGNPGTTLGQQRLLAFQRAAEIWGAVLESSVDIHVEARFDPLYCSSSGAVLGAAGTKTVSRDFANAPEAGTWYHIALANALAGNDLNGSTAEIRATFNGSMDNNDNCLSGTGWYYGLDGRAGRNIDLVTVLLHEFGHGLGFSTFVNKSTGTPFFGLPDTYMLNLQDHSLNKGWKDMSDGERAASAVDWRDLVWTGEQVKAASSLLTSGVNSQNEVEIYSPSTLRNGSSVSHFSTTLYPNELMEPFYTGVQHNPSLAVQLMTDIGWSLRNQADVSLSMASSQNGGLVGDTVQFVVTVHNAGPSQATGLDIALAWPAGITVVSASDASYDQPSATWNPPTLDAGQTHQITINGQINAAGSLDVVAELVAVDQPDPDSTPNNGAVNEDDYASVSLGSADIALRYQANYTTPIVGQAFAVYLYADNDGPDRVESLQVKVDVPDGLRFDSSNGMFDPVSGIWSIAPREAGESGSIQLMLTALNSDVQWLNAEVYSASLTDPDSVPNNGSTQEDDRVSIRIEPTAQQTADLALDAWFLDEASIGIGEVSRYQVLISNDGPDGLPWVYISTRIPDGVTLVDTFGSGTYLGTNNQGFARWQVDNLAADSEQSFGFYLKGEQRGSYILESEVEATTLIDPDSTPNNWLTGEDDYASADLAVEQQLPSGIILLNGDGPGEGFNDPATTMPVGGNPGITLGAQRLAVFERAAQIWSQALSVEVPVVVMARFDSLSCSSSSGVLGAAGPAQVARDFSGGAANTWYHMALANQLARSDLNGSGPEINATFNSSIDNNDSCLSGTNWYYGLDGNAQGNINLLSVVLHEFGHGLGFSSFVSQSGQRFFNLNDAYMRHLYDASSGVTWASMSDGARAASSVNTGNLVWNAAGLNSAASGLGAGLNNGKVQMFAPNPYRSGSSVSHFDTRLTPNELMEPYYTGATDNVGLAVNLLADMGWPLSQSADISVEVNVTNAKPVINGSTTISISIRNNGPAEASGIDVLMPLPEGLVLETSVPGYSSATGVLRLANSLGASTSTTVNLPVQVNTLSSVQIEAELIASSLPDPDSTPNNHVVSEDDHDTVTITPTQPISADLSMGLHVSTHSPNVGDTITATFSLQNAGPDAADDVQVRFNWPNGVNVASNVAGLDADTKVYQAGAIGASDGRSIAIPLTINTAASFNLSGQVISSSAPDPDSTPANNVGSEDDQIQLAITPLAQSSADLSLSMLVSNPSPKLNEQIQITVNLVNAGPATASNIVVSMPLPRGLRFDSGNQYHHGKQVWNVASLAPSASTQLAIMATVVDYGQYQLSSEVEAVDQSDPDSSPGNDDRAEDDFAERVVSVAQVAQADLSVTLSASPADIQVGDQVFIDVGVQNNGPAPSEGATIQLTLPANLTVLSTGSGYNASTKQWSLSGLDVGEQAVLQIKAVVDDVNPVNVVAEVVAASPADPDSIPGNGRHQEDDYAALSFVPSGQSTADLSLRLTADTLNPLVGESMTLTATIENAGPNVVSGVQAVIALPAGVSVLGSSGDYDSVTGLWNVGAIADADRTSIQLTLLAGESGQQEILAQIYAASLPDPDSTTGNGYQGEDDDASVVVNPVTPERADLRLVANLSNASPLVGNSTFYDVTLFNDGPNNASNIQVAIRLPGTVSLIDSSVTMNNGVVSIASLNAGTSQAIRVTVQVDDDSPATLMSEVVHSSLPDPDSTPGNALLDEDDQVATRLTPQSAPSADLMISIPALNTQPLIGETFEAIVRVRNDGPGAAESVRVDIATAAHIDVVGSQISLSAGEWYVGRIGAGQTIENRLQLQANETLVGEIVAEVVASSIADPDSTPNNGNYSEDDIAVITVRPEQVRYADLSLSNTLSHSDLRVGDTTQWLLNVINNGPDVVSQAAVRVNLPAGFDITGSTGSFSDGVFSIGSLTTQQQAQVSLTLRAVEAGVGNLEAEISRSDATDPDSVPNNGDATEDDYVSRGFVIERSPVADIEAAISVNNQRPSRNEQVVVTLSLTNQGPDIATGLAADLSLPNGLTFLSAEGEGLIDSNRWAIDKLRSGQTVSHRVTAIVQQVGSMPITLELIASDQGDPDSLPNNQVASEDDMVSVSLTSSDGSSGIIVLRNDDAPGEGFNDPTPTQPVGGNPATTLGEQRLFLFQYAADLWARHIHSTVTIVISAKFDPLTCSSGSGVLGAAGPMTVARDFPGAPIANTWYPAALANALSGVDQNGSTAEIRATFNSSIDNNNSCLQGTNWYYGIDGNPGRNIELLSTVVHEFGHGLGFLSLVNPNGEKFMGRDDVYMTHLQDYGVNRFWPGLTNSERAVNATSGNRLVFVGDELSQKSEGLNQGRKPNGSVEMYAPNPYRSGSSVSHFSTSLAPNDVMEPFYTGPNNDLTLAAALFKDLGWPQIDQADLSVDISVDNPAPAVNDQVVATITVTNSGPAALSQAQVAVDIGDGLVVLSNSADDVFQAEEGSWLLSNIGVNETRTLQLVVSVAASGNKSLVAEVMSASLSDTDSTPANGNATEDDYAQLNLGNADLSVVMGLSEESVYRGDFVTLDVQIANAGPDDATGLVVDIRLPSSVTLIEEQGVGQLDLTTMRWTLDSVPANGLYSRELVLQVNGLDQIALEAELMAANESDPDSTPGNGVLTEDDLTITFVNSTEPNFSGIDLILDGVYQDSCPQMSVRFSLERESAPINGFVAEQFTLREDGTPLVFEFNAVSDRGEYEIRYQTEHRDGKAHRLDITVDDDLADNVNFTTTVISCSDEPVAVGGDGSEGPIAVLDDGWHIYHVDIPSNQSILNVSTEGGTGDLDLYLAHEQIPSLGQFDYRSDASGNSESILVERPLGGRWYIGLYAKQAFSGATLNVAFSPIRFELSTQALYTEECPEIGVVVSATADGQKLENLLAADFTLTEDEVEQSIQFQTQDNGDYLLTYTTPNPDGGVHDVEVTATINGESIVTAQSYRHCNAGGVVTINNYQRVDNIDGREGSWHTYRLVVPNGQNRLTIFTEKGTGDGDLYVRLGSAPTTTAFDFHPNLTGNNEQVTIQDPVAGDWYIAVYGASGFEDLELVAGYESNQLAVALEPVNIGSCPALSLVAHISNQGSPLTQLVGGDFTLTENDNAVTISAVTEVSDGEYRIDYTTTQTSGDSSNLVLGVTHNGFTAANNVTFSHCTNRGAVVDAWINSAHAAPVGTEVVIPVYLGYVSEEMDVRSFSFHVDYNTTVLSFLGAEGANTLSEGWSIDDASEPGRVVVEAGLLDLQQPALEGTDAALVNLRFLVETVDESCSALELHSLSFGGLVSGDMQDGQFCGTPGDCPHALGDINGDGNNAQAFDALQILNYIADIPTDYDPIPLCVADTNCSGSLAVMDAVNILRRNVELIDDYCPPADAGNLVNSGLSFGGFGGAEQNSGSFAVTIAESGTTLAPTEAFELSIQLTERPADSVYGYRFNLVYDAQVVTIDDVLIQQDTLTERWAAPMVNANPGAIRVVHVNALSEIDGTGTLIKVRGQALSKAGNASIVLQGFQLASDSEPAAQFGPFDLIVDTSIALDTDNDGIPDVNDPDDDNDGVPDDRDDLPLNPFESVDTDGDGIGNNSDMDDDGDGILDNHDLDPLNPNVGSSLDKVRLDQDGDKKADIVVRNEQSGESALWRMNGESLEEAIALANVSSDWRIAARADFNGDGSSDLLWRNIVNGDNYVYLMYGANIFSQGALNRVGLEWSVIGTADFNGDQRDDILWFNAEDNALYLYEMDGTRSLQGHAVNALADSLWQVAGVGDMTGDGKADILKRHSETGQTQIVEMNGPTVVAEHGLGTVVPDWHILGVGDFSGDGQFDILWRHMDRGMNYVYVIQEGQIAAQGQVNQFAGNDWQLKQIADFNGDGSDDLLWLNQPTSELVIYFLSGTELDGVRYIDATLEEDWNVTPYVSSAIEVDDDQNRDGRADIWWHNQQSGKNWIYYMNGTQVDGGAPVNVVNAVWQGMRGDLNGDGTADLVWRNTSNGQNYGYLMSDNQLIEGTSLPVVPLDWTLQAIADFDGNGSDDLLWYQSSTGTVWLYQMDGLVVSASTKVATVSTDWRIDGVGDISGDGKADILWRHTSSGLLWVYEMNGPVISNNFSIATVGLEWQIAAIADLTGNGSADIVWRNQQSGQNWLYAMRQSTIESSAAINRVSDLNWQIAQAADFDGDGRADLLWRNATTGENAVYLMQGHQIELIKGINSVPVEWRVVR